MPMESMTSDHSAVGIFPNFHGESHSRVDFVTAPSVTNALKSATSRLDRRAGHIDLPSKDCQPRPVARCTSHLCQVTHPKLPGSASQACCELQRLQGHASPARHQHLCCWLSVMWPTQAPTNSCCCNCHPWLSPADLHRSSAAHASHVRPALLLLLRYCCCCCCSICTA
jgi:hypothetical protein